MVKRSKKLVKRTPPKPRAPVGSSLESRAAEAATVAWTLSFLATTGADLFALALWLFGRFWPVAAGPQGPWLFLPLLALFIAAVSGLVCLILTPVVLRLRNIAPPREITFFAIVASVMPLGTLAILLLGG